MNLTLRRSIAAAVVLLPVLSACGFDVPTNKVYTPGVGVNDRSSSVQVLHALIVSGSDGSGTVIAGLNDNTNHGDALTRITGSGSNSDVSVNLRAPVRIQPQGFVQLANESTPPVALGKSIKAGYFVQLTFSFQRGQDVTLQVPVVPPTGDFSGVPVPSGSSSAATPLPSTSPSKSATKSPSKPASKSPSQSPSGSASPQG